MSEQTLSTPMTLLVRRIKANDWMIGQAIDGLTDADWSRRIEGASSPAWLLGHIAGSRRNMARAAGIALEKAEWEAAINRGTNGELDPSAAASDPSLSHTAFFEDLQARSQELQERLAGMSEEEAAEDTGIVTPDRSRDRIGVLYFFYFHETYHVGQLGLLRRQLGHERIV